MDPMAFWGLKIILSENTLQIKSFLQINFSSHKHI
jgi:hypothetical protein